VFRQVVSAWGNEDLIEKAFTIEEYDASSNPAVGPLRFSFCHVPHFQETFAICVQSSNSERRFVFGADSRPTEQLVEFARGADLLLIEATLPRPERSGERGHLTPREAGEHGRDAGAKRLVLTHISDELDHLWARKEAQAAFDGEVEVAREGAVYEL
jgi:ribonuclease BN (tRNA processing enzyme)